MLPLGATRATAWCACAEGEARCIHAHCRRLAAAEGTSAKDYGEQQETLNRLFELEDAETFASSYFVAESRGTRGHVSYCVWTDGVTQVLPKTDVVAFMFSDAPEEGCVVAADWDSVCSTMAEAMTPVGSYPERYLVSQSPTPDQLSAMGARNLTEYLSGLPDSGD